MHTIPLPGCSPTPLAAYLKALGILRVLSQQCPDAQAKGYWRGNAFTLVSTYDREALLNFFLTHYAPSSVVAPWNGGSGFMDGNDEPMISAILKSEADRFEHYRAVVQATYNAMNDLGLTATAQEIRSAQEKRKTAKKTKGKIPKEEYEEQVKECDKRVNSAKAVFQDAKVKLLLRCRNTFPENALEWLDAAYVLTDDGAKYPPLLGTGGNDGNFDFTYNFMLRLSEVFDLAKGVPTSDSPAFLCNALFDTPTKNLADNPIGQFSPSASGGANATTGFDAKSAVNPWDFILALEGAMLFAAAAVKRLESLSPGQLVYPFCVQPSGAGYGSATQSDENAARCEIWVPLWSAPSGLDEIKSLFSEGRAWVGKRTVKNGIDFALAVSSLGVDRGIGEFQRYGFHVRNGLAYFATPLQRLRVHRDTVSSDLLAACDGWLQRFLPKAKGDTAPGSVRRAAARLEAAIFARAVSAQDNNPDTAQELLIALGECERTLSRASEKWRADSFLKPLPPLPRGWIKATDNHTAEYRLAAALASLSVRFKKEFYPLRRHLEPVKVIAGEKAWTDWLDKSDPARNEVVWHEGSVIDVLCAMMKRRLLLAKSAGESSWPEYARLTAWPTDIAAFIDGRIDETRFAQLLWGLSLVDFSGDAMTGDEMPTPPSRIYDETPSAFYAQLKLCFASRLPDDKRVPIEPIIFNLAASGDGARASTQALRRLHGSSIPVTSIQIPLAGEAARRSASALLFPLWDTQLAAVGRAVAPDFFPQLNLR
ncbi:MAG: type I-U CRISPR-associated protein Csx17 [Verrucomicrobia bacterium]|nr:type I-U CRISPR-associated protein Csx17 [Verrucomicrobiota bacterium]